MSGGHYEYAYFRIRDLADYIEQDFANDGKYMQEDYSNEGTRFGKRNEVEADRIGDATVKERPLILEEIKSLVEDLKSCAARAKELEWYMSGDTGATSYLERLKTIQDDINR